MQLWDLPIHSTLILCPINVDKTIIDLIKILISLALLFSGKMRLLEYIVALLCVQTCTGQKFYYKENNNVYDVYYGPSSLWGYQEMLSPKSFKPSFDNRGGKCHHFYFVSKNLRYPLTLREASNFLILKNCIFQ